MPNFVDKTYALFSGATNKKLIAALEKANAKFFLFPPLEIEKIFSDQESFTETIDFKRFDWVIFPDVLSVEFFLQALEENEVDLFEMDLIQVCAVGEAVADRLRFAQLHADIIPGSNSAADILKTLADYVGKVQPDSLKFLMLKGIPLKYEIEEKLIELGANLVSIPIYQAKGSNPREIAKLKVLLAGGAIDEFILSTPTDLIALKLYFDNRSISQILSEIKVSTIDRAMFQMLKEHELKAEYAQFK